MKLVLIVSLLITLIGCCSSNDEKDVAAARVMAREKKCGQVANALKAKYKYLLANNGVNTFECEIHLTKKKEEKYVYLSDNDIDAMVRFIYISSKWGAL